MCDESKHAAHYVLIIEDYPDEKTAETRKFAPVAFGSKRFTTVQISSSIYAKEFLAKLLAFDEFGHIWCGTKEPIIVMTDNKALIWLFQAKYFHPILWTSVFNPYNLILCQFLFPVMRTQWPTTWGENIITTNRFSSSVSMTSLQRSPNKRKAKRIITLTTNLMRITENICQTHRMPQQQVKQSKCSSHR